MSCASALTWGSLAAAVLLLGVPAYLADASDARRLGFYGHDYENNLCGQVGWHAGAPHRDLRSRPFMYWMNASTPVCVRSCPRLADELVCEYPYESSPVHVQRSHLGTRCHAQQRTHAKFLTCFPEAPSASRTADLWLSRHTLDQLAADTLQSSGVILGCWFAAVLSSMLVMILLYLVPQTTLMLSLLGALALAPAHALLLLPYAEAQLAAAKLPALRGAGISLGDVATAQLHYGAGWLALCVVVLLVLMLAFKARRAPVAAALVAASRVALSASPVLFALPLYVCLAVGAAFCSWITATIYLAAPAAPSAPAGGAHGGGGGDASEMWPALLLAPIWISALLIAWEYMAVAGVVCCWYRDERLAGTAGAAAGRVRRQWPLWRSGWLALGRHTGSLGVGALLLPLGAVVRLLVPQEGSAPRRDASPVPRALLGAVQGCLRCATLCVRPVHGAALVQLVLHGPIASRRYGDAMEEPYDGESFLSAGAAVCRRHRRSRAPSVASAPMRRTARARPY